MKLVGVARKRTLAQAPLLWALAAVVAALTFVLTGVESSFSSSQDEGVASALQQGPARAAALQITSGVDRPEESEAAKDAAERISQSAPTDVAHRFVSDSFTGSAGRTYVAATMPDLPDHAELVGGRWATADGEASVQADSGLVAGDDVSAGDVRLKIVGTWRVTDPGDPRWFADPAVLSGADKTAVGPLVVSRKTLDALPTSIEQQWTIVPQAERYATDDLRELADGLGRILAEDPADGVGIEGLLAERVDAVNRVLQASRSLEVVALMILGVVGLVTLLQLLDLLGEARQREAVLLRVRGGSVAQIARWHGLDVAVVSIVSAAAGAAAVAATMGKPSLLLVCCVAVPAVVLGPTFAARRARRVTAHAGRESSLALGSMAFVACAAATLTVVQFLSYGSSVTTDSDGRPAIDPLTVLAPGLTLVAGALVGALVAGPLARLAARRATPRTGLSPVLGLQQIARSPRTFGVLITLSALIVGNVMAAATYSATARSVAERVSMSAVGADVRVELDVDNSSASETTAADGERLAVLPGVTSSSPALGGTGRIQDRDVPFLAIKTDDFADLEVPGPVRAAISGSKSPGAAVTESLATSQGLKVGAPIVVEMPDGIGQLTTVVRAIVRALPGLPTDGGVLVNMSSVQDALAKANLTPAEPNVFLVQTDKPQSTALAAVAAVTHAADVSVADTDGSLIQPASAAWARTTMGVIGIGLLGIFAVAVALVGRRAGEVRVLRALGLRTSGQRRARLVELAAALGAGALAGFVTSLVMIATTVPGLVRAPRLAQAPDIPLGLHLDAPLLLAAAALTIAGLVVAGMAYGRAVARQARQLVRGEST